MFRNNLHGFAIWLLVVFVTTGLSAQDSKPQMPTSTYKLDYVFSELQDGKRINARSYSALVRLMDKGSIRLGNRVPILVANSKDGGNQIQYLDIGVNIDCRVEQEVEGGVTLFTNVETSSLAP